MCESDAQFSSHVSVLLKDDYSGDREEEDWKMIDGGEKSEVE